MTIWAGLQAPDDYHQRYLFVAMIRWVRYLGWDSNCVNYGISYQGWVNHDPIRQSVGICCIPYLRNWDPTFFMDCLGHQKAVPKTGFESPMILALSNLP